MRTVQWYTECAVSKTIAERKKYKMLLMKLFIPDSNEALEVHYLPIRVLAKLKSREEQTFYAK